ncbi:MAG: bifunctional phosphoribosyl-AMP cyclohydrolase/phosphoribosyl-ATP diphosphatase HisIE [Nanoarchaeota archaeon]|nr:bifunctional phosphoribosyl-AMP cyclohydrolase/phosphoribosyl-ATP diphosphatase HisIE [Nanoarchaeota archaeon]
MIIPSIDIMDGKAVQLKQGKEKVLEREDVLALAKEFRKYGELAVIDLDAALGKGENTELIKQICGIAECRVGGGIRTIEKANEYLAAGAVKVIIGTRANSDFLRQLPKDRVIVAVDTKDGFVVNKGWRARTKKRPKDLISELEGYCSGFLFTDVDREGLLKGIDVRKAKRIKDLTRNRVTFAGGITGVAEIMLLESMGIDSQVGMSLYTGKISLPEAFLSLMDFSKNAGLIPTIVQDEEKQVLMLAFSSKESLLKTFKEGKAAYFSRSRSKLWTKGETSGCFQELIKARYDCDRDALLFTVRQTKQACHAGVYSCFGEKEFSLQELYGVIEDRLKNPRAGSFTAKIASSEKKIKDKINEEAQEVINYTSRDNLVWEVADTLYFLIVLMAKKGIPLKEVENELWRRRR